MAAVIMLLLACSTVETDSSAPAIAAVEESSLPATATVGEIMRDIVRPAADVLWGATAVYVTMEGEDDRSPKNDEEWQTVDQSRIAMEEAIEALLVPDRKVDVDDAVPYAAEDLKPEEIEALIKREPDIWVAMVHALGDTMQQTQKAIEDQDVEALTEIGADIDDACESCHAHFWYPEQ